MANGFIIAYSGIHPFVVTLAMQSILRGVAYLLANAQPVPLYVNEVFPSIGIARVMGVPLPIIYLIILFFVQWLLLNKTKTGRYIYQSVEMRQLQDSPVSTLRRSRFWYGPSVVCSAHSQESSFPQS